LVAWGLLWILDWITSCLCLDVSESNNSNKNLHPTQHTWSQSNVQKSNSIKLIPWIEFDWVQHRTRNQTPNFVWEQIEPSPSDSVLLTSAIKLNRTQFNPIQWIVFDCVQWINLFEQTVMLCSLKNRNLHVKHVILLKVTQASKNLLLIFRTSYTKIKSSENKCLIGFNYPIISAWVPFHLIAKFNQTQSMDWVRLTLIGVWLVTDFQFDWLCLEPRKTQGIWNVKEFKLLEEHSDPALQDSELTRLLTSGFERETSLDFLLQTLHIFQEFPYFTGKLFIYCTCNFNIFMWGFLRSWPWLMALQVKEDNLRKMET